MTTFDYFVLFVLLVSSLYGFYRGLVKEVLSIVGLVLSFYLASRYSDLLIGLLPINETAEWANLFAFIVIFISTLIFFSILSKLITKIIKASGLSFLNRILGMSFGILRGLFFILLLVYVANLIPFINLINKENSILMPFLDPIFAIVLDYLPKYQPTHVEYEYQEITRELF
jgi:membrane protein required for colicin V production